MEAIPTAYGQNIIVEDICKKEQDLKDVLNMTSEFLVEIANKQDPLNGVDLSNGLVPVLEGYSKLLDLYLSVAGEIWVAGADTDGNQ